MHFFSDIHLKQEEKGNVFTLQQDSCTMFFSGLDGTHQKYGALAQSHVKHTGHSTNQCI